MCSDLDELKYSFASTTDKEASTLPPTKDALKQHVLRAMLQTRVWCQSDILKPNISDLIVQGWQLDENRCLKPTIHEQKFTPKDVRDITHLSCSDQSCTTSRNCPRFLATGVHWALVLHQLLKQNQLIRNYTYLSTECTQSINFSL